MDSFFFFFQHFEFLIPLTSGLHYFIDAHLYVMIYFSLAAFKIFSLSLFTSSLIMLCWNIRLFIFVLRGVCWISLMSRWIFFIKFGMFLSLISSHIFFYPFFCLHSFCDTHYMLFDIVVIIQNVWVFVLFLKIYLFNLFIFGCAGSSLLHVGSL